MYKYIDDCEKEKKRALWGALLLLSMVLVLEFKEYINFIVMTIYFTYIFFHATWLIVPYVGCTMDSYNKYNNKK